MSPVAWIFSLPVKGYRLIFSPWVGYNCRYQPSCSQYALDALKEHGGIIGGLYAMRRILRCNPWGGCGYDPVPPNKTNKTRL